MVSGESDQSPVIPLMCVDGQTISRERRSKKGQDTLMTPRGKRLKRMAKRSIAT